MSEANDDIARGEILNTVCRACMQVLNTDSVMYNIFDDCSPSKDGMGSIAEDLEMLTKIQVRETDNQSKMICDTCCQLALSMSNFVKMLKKNNEVLSQETPIPKELDNGIWPKPIKVDKSLPNMFKDSMDVEIKQEVVSDEDEDCPSVNGSCYSNMDEMPNLDIVKVEPEELIQQQPIKIQFTESLKELKDQLHEEVMNDCDKAITNGNTASGDNHSDVNIEEEPLSEDEMELFQQDTPLECILCATPFNSVSGLKAHVIAHHSYKTVTRKNSTSVSPERKYLNHR